MYLFLKKLAKQILPKRVLIANEQLFRRAYAKLWYRGNRHRCTVCNTSLSRFILLEGGDLLCPACGSLPRHRRLWQVLNEDISLQGKVLHFSPSRALYPKLKKLSGIEYISSDYGDEFPADKKLDITNIEEPSNSFDFIICYHVLEHIKDDKKAMGELLRILKPGGQVIIQTPFKEGAIYENDSVTSPGGRLQHFGQEDHVRIYSVEGLKRRLQKTGFDVQVKGFGVDATTERLGFKKQEYILLGKKPYQK